MHRSLPLLLVLAAAGLCTSCGRQAAPVAPPAPVVTVLAVQPEDVPVRSTMVGRVVSNRSVAIVARVTGLLLEHPFSEGGIVKEGDVLFRIDPSEYQANLDAAAARQTQAENKLAKAEADRKRAESLLGGGGISQQQADEARTVAAVATADLRAAQAAVASARLMLDYTTIRAPFSGRVGPAAVSAGAIVSPQTGTLVTLDQVDPIDIEFNLSEEGLLKLNAEIQSGQVVSAALDQLTFTATLLDGTVFPQTGTLSFADIRFRAETGTVAAKAQFPNPKGKLLPGQFSRISVTGLTRKGALLVPQGAVLQTPVGPAVYLVTAAGTAEARPVELGEWDGRRWRVVAGLKAGDRVIVDGIQKVRAGLKVDVAGAK